MSYYIGNKTYDINMTLDFEAKLIWVHLWAEREGVRLVNETSQMNWAEIAL